MIDYSKIDEGVRTLVRFLNDKGFEILTSCQGGEGRTFNFPTVRLKFVGDHAAERHALACVLIGAGVVGFTISEQYDYQQSISYHCTSQIALEVWDLKSLAVLENVA